MNRTIKWLGVSVGAGALLGTLPLGMSDAGAIWAAPTQISPAGTYLSEVTFTGEPPIPPLLTLTSAHHFAFQHGPSGTWSESGRTITMRSTPIGGSTLVFDVTQRVRNLGSASKPGKFYVNGAPAGTWYATRTSS